MPQNWIENSKRLESENGLRLGTCNVKTLNKSGTLQYLLDIYNNYTIDVLAIQEIRWPNKDGSVGPKPNRYAKEEE